MTWGGVRGGISIALALSIPENEYKSLILSITYVVVCFSIIVQGLTIKPLVEKLTCPKKHGLSNPQPLTQMWNR
jgi:CPA1 family monovalent cation:H+ antiporter